ncbi:hypothetical protein [Marinobacter profundi]|uniref:DUF4760 domain-containing protein n=1 Tax=Marinobacter profundi TaxID=2666256 RepID=A0A2G1ULQ7_9GAMM|nr:hypothetical protein [Marinobacter profundi]PHQ15393.1 hypothetical protein CLH61_09750 [Marinobacter profundi]
MRDFRLSLVVFTILLFAVGGAYILTMLSNGHATLSPSNQDWASFGAYFGGVLAPAASLLAGYLVYKSFRSNTYQQKLLVIREALGRLDQRLEHNLDAPFNNDCFGEKYRGLSVRQLVYSVSNEELESNETFDSALLSLLHNISILSHSILVYLKLLEKFPTDETDTNWLRNLEHHYWIDKYSPICRRIKKIVGRGAMEEKIKSHHLESFRVIFNGGYDL